MRTDRSRIVGLDIGGSKTHAIASALDAAGFTESLVLQGDPVHSAINLARHLAVTPATT